VPHIYFKKIDYTKPWHGQIDTNYTQIFSHYSPQSYHTQNQSQICPHYSPQTLQHRIKPEPLKNKIRFRFLHYLGIEPWSSFTFFESLELGVGSQHRFLEPNLTLIPNCFGKRNFMHPMGRPKACFTFLSFILSPFFVSRFTMDHRTKKKCKTNPTKHGLFGPWINEPCTHLLFL